MSLEALKTLFHPFGIDALAPPGIDERVLFLGAEPGLRLADGFEASIIAVQGFRPSFVKLQQQGRTVLPSVDGNDYDMALVLCGRHRGQNETWVAQALRRTSAGGLIVVAGGKDDGIASLRKRLEGHIAIVGSIPKYHGIAFWFARPGNVDPLVEILDGGSAPPVDGIYQTAPGMFSHDRIDAGSKLLADNLPKAMKGKVADFCAGWGYLAAEVAVRYPGIKGLDLYEADFASLEAAKANLASKTTIPLRFLWQDLVAEPVGEHYDFIVMNPPFHTERRADPGLGQALIKVASRALKRGGHLLMVANRQLAYEHAVAETFHRQEEIAGDKMYKIIAAIR